ncbi:MAG TPA: hypothetical protein VNJ01_02465 [Bacteriovoracaceae bacterium]|nr:hypothetical protein [Bacteriovoracaceae bacterium]
MKLSSSANSYQYLFLGGILGEFLALPLSKRPESFRRDTMFGLINAAVEIYVEEETMIPIRVFGAQDLEEFEFIS